MTLIDVMKQFNGLNADLQSAEHKRQFMKDFVRDNQLLAKFYADTIRQNLAQRGWFIAGSLYPHQYQPLAKAIKEQAEDQVEGFLKIHVRNLISDIRESSTRQWEKRAEILNDAFDAHIAEKYTLSVPVFLAQSDGIAADLLGTYLFTNHNGPIKDAASKFIQSHFHERPLAKSFLGLFLEASGLRLDTRKRAELEATGCIFSSLNRHGVLHGLDCDYATEGNSLRGIALIGFLVWVARANPIKESPATQ